MRFRGRYGTTLLLACVLVWTALVLLPGVWWDPQKYSAWASGLSAFAVALALGLAVVTLRTDVKDRQVDRTLALHAELTSGEINEARVRLVDHLRAHGQVDASGHRRPARASVAELRGTTGLGVYNQGVGSTPKSDLSQLLRFFERARLVREAGSIDEPLFVELIGRHAGWWNCALVRNSDWGSRRTLMELGLWCDGFAERNESRYPYLARWGKARSNDFGSKTPWQGDPP